LAQRNEATTTTPGGFYEATSIDDARRGSVLVTPDLKAELDLKADAADLINFAPKPQTAAGVGQFVVVYADYGDAYYLPADGSWATQWTSVNPAGVRTGVGANIFPGGTKLNTASPDISISGWAWRIA
jgi:hypothetical protein